MSSSKVFSPSCPPLRGSLHRVLVSRVDRLAVLCPSELYSICLSRAREKWSSTPSHSLETEPEGRDAAAPVRPSGETVNSTRVTVSPSGSDPGSSDRESSLELIKLDISRTFPHLCIFQQVSEIGSSPLQSPLLYCLNILSVRILRNYICHFLFHCLHDSFVTRQGGPYHDVLHSILGAYTCYRPDVGYVSHTHTHTHTHTPHTP